MGVKLKEFIAIIVLGAIGWSIIFSLGYGRPTIYLPQPAFGMEQYGGAAWVGAIIGWMIICFIPGVPLLVALKQLHKRSEKFRKFVEKVK